MADDIWRRFKNHDINLTRDPGRSWYIRVTGPDGMRVYDGYWHGSAERTAKDALYEAKVGAGLLKPSPRMDPHGQAPADGAAPADGGKTEEDRG